MTAEEKILNFIRNKVSPCTEEEIKNINKEISISEIQNILHKLQFNNQIKRNSKNEIIYIRKPEEDEKLIYNLLKESSSKGLTMRDLKFTTKLPQNLITKILKKMEDKNLIKNIKGQKNKLKVYLLFDEMPDLELTGGIFYTRGEVDTEFVNQLTKLVFNYLKNRTKILLPFDCNPTQTDISQFITSTNVLSVSISDSDLKNLLDVMVLSEMIQELKKGKKIMYRALKVNWDEELKN